MKSLVVVFNDVNEKMLAEIEYIKRAFDELTNDVVVDNFSGDAYDAMCEKFIASRPNLDDPYYTFSQLVKNNPIFARMYAKMRKQAEIEASWAVFKEYCNDFSLAMQDHKEGMLLIYANAYTNEGN